jgi:hypothetical protein
MNNTKQSKKFEKFDKAMDQIMSITREKNWIDA